MTRSLSKEVYGRLTINSFEMTDVDDFAVGWGLYLAPSILNHSCVPNAEANFEGNYRSTYRNMKESKR